MKKRVIILVVGFLFIGFNVFAADGDLIVNGKVGIGTTTPDSTTEIQFTGGGGKIGLHVEDNGAGSDTLLKLDDPSGNIGSDSYFIRALDGTANAFYIKGDGSAYFKGNLGLGVAPNSEYSIYLEKDYTNPTSGTSYAYLNGTPTYTGEETVAETFDGIRAYIKPIINTNHNNSGMVRGYYAQVLRNSNGISSDDNGTLTTLRGGHFVYGHYNTNTNATPQTTNVYGLSLTPDYMTGTITNLYDIYIASGNSGGTVTNRYGIYQVSTAAKNYFAGNVGIGATNPTYLLTMEVSGGGYYNQTTHSWVDGSSGRWKSSVRPITGALDKVLKLNGVSFKWKKRTDQFRDKDDGTKEYISSSWNDDPDGKEDIGLVGEEVMKILPEVVDIDQNDSNFATGVSYSKIMPLLIEAIKEQQKVIDDLRARLEQIEAE